ncbi:MAG: Sec-independent protein translocase protein TatB [Pseudomonadota bacterium]
MFDIGFTELLVIGVVALLVIGPERLPKVARTAGAWMGRLNRYVSEVKGDINRELRMEELRKLQEEMKASAQKYELMAAETGQEIKREVDQVDKVIQAMSLTDGGLSQREFAKAKAEIATAPADLDPGPATEPLPTPVVAAPVAEVPVPRPDVPDAMPAAVPGATDKTA